MATIHVEIVSAEGAVYSGEAGMVFAPARLGDLGIAPRHAPLLTELRPGAVRVQAAEGGEELHFFISGGMLEVQPHLVTVLADTALRADDIDEAAALEAKRRAEEALENRDSTIDYARAQAELAAALQQLRALDQWRKTLRR